MSKIVLSPSAGEQLGNGRDLAVALGRLKTVSAMVQQGSIDTENALRDTATGAYLLPYEGSRHFGQNGYLSLPHEYVVNRSGDSERVSQQDPTYSFVALQQGLFSLGRSIFTVYSCRPDVVIAAVPSKKSRSTMCWIDSHGLAQLPLRDKSLSSKIVKLSEMTG